MSIEIREVGEKLRELRKSLGLKQEELVKYGGGKDDKVFTRNLISMVESGKASLTDKLGKCVVKNIEKCCKDRGIEVEYDFDMIARTPEQQVRDYINEYIEKISGIISYEESVRYVDELSRLAKKYKLYKELCLLNVRIGKVAKDNSDEVLKHLTNAYVLKEELDGDELNELVRMMKHEMILNKQYEESLGIEPTRKCDDDDLLRRCLFNDILALVSLERLKEARIKIREIDYIEHSPRDITEIKLRMIEANICMINKERENAMSILNKLKKQDIPHEEMMIVKLNIIKLKTEKTENIDEHLDEIVEELNVEEISKGKLTEMLFKFIEALKAVPDKKVQYYYKKILDLSIDINNKAVFDMVLLKVHYLNSLGFDYEDMTIEEMQMYVTSGIKSDLIEDNTLLKIMLFFQKNENYNVVSNILEKSIG